jgi:hypothetical protein
MGRQPRTHGADRLPITFRRPSLRLFAVPAVALAAGCGGGAVGGGPGTASTVAARAAPLTPWPTEADYATIRTAAAIRDHALFHDADWRTKSLSAGLAIRTLLTVRIAPGSCATYVGQLYGNLLDLHDAYPGEDWRPLIRLVRRQPSLVTSCRQHAAPANPSSPGEWSAQLVA